MDKEKESFSNRYHNETLAFQLRIDRNLTGSYAIFFGDSHVQGLAVQELAIPSVNFGIGSDTTQGVLQRLPLYESIDDALLIYLAIGFNDLKDTADEDILQNFRVILESLPHNKVVALSLILPIDEEFFIHTDVTNSRINQLNRSLEELQYAYSNVEVVMPGGKLVNHNGNLNRQYHIGDGIHLNSLGYAVMIDYLKTEFQKLLLINRD